MTEFIRETVTNQGDNPGVITKTNREATGYQTAEYLLYFFFGILEILLAFRLILRLTGANTFSAFVGLVYGVTGIFILPFQGIFHQATTAGMETTAVLEPATIVAIVVYAALAVGVVKLVRIFSGKQQAS